jgi:hypothetical protein
MFVEWAYSSRNTVWLGFHDRVLELFLSKQSRVVHYDCLRGPLATSISTPFIGMFNWIAVVGEEVRSAVV